MTKFQRLLLLGSLGVFLATRNATAQLGTVQPTTREGTRSGRVIVPEKPAVSLINPELNAVRPVRSEFNALDPLTKDRIASFERAREAFLAKIAELEKQARGANDQERAQIRERINELRRELLERARAIREEASERKRELLERLPKHREVLDEARDKAREQLNSTRKRRGED
jgi:Skp family chaperone for outer membrane proteins